MKSIFIALVFLLAYSPSAQTALSQDRLLYVAKDGNDANNGGPNRPLLTISEAAKRAVENKVNGRSTLVRIGPGIYRETVDLSTWTNFFRNQPGNKSTMTFQASNPGSVTISGSEVWRDWAYDSDVGAYRHSWLFDWGLSSDPSDGRHDVKEIVRRREMVFVDGELLTQVTSRGELKAGSFYVSEGSNTIYVKGPNGKSLNDAFVEVAEREQLWVQNWEFNVTIQGIRFQHAATRWEDPDAAILISGGSGLRVVDSQIQWNNGRGIYIGDTNGATLDRVRMNNNGGDGWGTWYVTGFKANDSETNYNNWRGHLGQYYVWSVGNKLLNTHGLELTRHRAVGNFSRGLWLDLDNRNVVFDEVTIEGNLSDAIFIEANAGPIQIKNSQFSNNGGFAIFAANSENVKLHDNVFADNKEGGLYATGLNGGRSVRNWQTDERTTLFLKDWELYGNAIIGKGGNSDFLVATSLQEDGWDIFEETLRSDRNVWDHPDRPAVFELPEDEILTFSGWQEATRQDQNSKFGATLPVGVEYFEATVEARDVFLSWATDQEIDNLGFDVEMFIDESWTSVGFVEGLGLSQTLQEYSYTALDLDPGRYQFRLKQMDFDGSFEYGSMVEVFVTLEEPFFIGSPYPNPTTGVTTVSLGVPSDQEVTVELYNMIGQRIDEVFKGELEGHVSQRIEIDASRFPAGVYLYKLTGETFSEGRTFVVTR